MSQGKPGKPGKKLFLNFRGNMENLGNFWDFPGESGKTQEFFKIILFVFSDENYKYRSNKDILFLYLFKCISDDIYSCFELPKECSMCECWLSVVLITIDFLKGEKLIFCSVIDLLLCIHTVMVPMQWISRLPMNFRHYLSTQVQNEVLILEKNIYFSREAQGISYHLKPTFRWNSGKTEGILYSNSCMNTVSTSRWQ